MGVAIAVAGTALAIAGTLVGPLFRPATLVILAGLLTTAGAGVWSSVHSE